MTEVTKNCAACWEVITVRLADHKRGWGKFCDKSCAAAYKTGQRPRDVNAEHAKYSPWAEARMAERERDYGGNAPPTAPSIREQLGNRVKVKPVHYRRPYNLEPDYNEDPSWDAHKDWTK